MNENLSSRRAVISACVATGTVAVAGCLGGNDDSDSDPGNGNSSENGTDGSQATDPSPDQFELAESGADAFHPWLLPDVVISRDTTELVCDYIDFDAAAQQNVTGMQERRTTLSGEFDIEPGALDGELLVGVPGNEGTTPIYLGTFPVEQVVDVFTEGPDWERSGDYRDYSVIDAPDQDDGTLSGAAVGSDAIINTPFYERHIDAALGDGQRLADSDEDAALLFDLLPTGVQTAVSYHPELDDVAINGEVSTVYEDGALARSVRTLVFQTDSDASTDRAREIMDDGVGYAGIHTEESHGRVAMIEYTPGSD